MPMEDDCCEFLWKISSTQNGDGSYNVTVVKITQNYSLESFKYYLKKQDGRTEQFGKIALQNLSGRWGGVDVTWDDNGSNDLDPGNHQSDRNSTDGGAYSDPLQAQIRIDDIINGTQENKTHQRSEGTISVSYYDRDLNGLFSAGDTFVIQGNNDQHPANDDYYLEICYECISDGGMVRIRLGDTISG